MNYWTQFARMGDLNGNGTVPWPAYSQDGDAHPISVSALSTGPGRRKAQCNLLKVLPLVLSLLVWAGDTGQTAFAQEVRGPLGDAAREPFGYTGVLGLLNSNVVNDSRLGNKPVQFDDKKWSQFALICYWPPVVFQYVYDKYDPLFADLPKLPANERLAKYDYLIDQMNAEVFKRLDGILDAGRMERLRQLDRRAQGPRVFRDPDVLKKLTVTDEQRTNMTAIGSAGDQKIAEILKSSKRDEAAKEISAAKRKTLEEIVGLFTREQKATWEKLLGEPLEIPQPRARTDDSSRTLTGHSWLAYAVAYSPDGKTLLSGSWDTTAKLWDVATGKEVRTLTGHTQRIRAVAWSPKGDLVATGSWDNTARLWDAATGKEVRTLRHPLVNSVAFSPDGKWLASASTSSDGKLSLGDRSVDPTIKLWEVATGDEVRTLRGHTFYVYSVAFSPDGKRLASGSRDETVRLWDVATGKETHILKTCNGWALSVAFSPDGKTLAVGTRDKTVVLFDVAERKQVCTFTGGHSDWAYAVAFSPDGKRLASGSKDATIKLWDVATGKEVRTLKGHGSCVRSVAFSPDGKTLASGSWDYTVKLWDVSQR